MSEMNLGNLPCSAVVQEIDSLRVKLNVDPGSGGIQVVLLHLSAEDAAFFKEGRRYSVVITDEEGPSTTEG